MVLWTHVKVMWYLEFLEASNFSQIIKKARLSDASPHRAFFMHHTEPLLTAKPQNLKFISPDLPYKMLKTT